MLNIKSVYGAAQRLNISFLRIVYLTRYHHWSKLIYCRPIFIKLICAIVIGENICSGKNTQKGNYYEYYDWTITGKTALRVLRILPGFFSLKHQCDKGMGDIPVASINIKGQYPHLHFEHKKH